MARRRGRRAPRTEIGFLTRYPSPGTAKTRLVPALGPEGAAELHDELTRHCLDVLRPLEITGEARIVVHVAGTSPRAARRWLRRGHDIADAPRGGHVRAPTVLPQTAGGLGRAISSALDSAFGRGAERVIVVGSDCPGLDARVARDAIRRLGTADCVLGPAADGGYYLLGLDRASSGSADDLLRDIEWGGGSVLEQTLRRAHGAGLRVSLTEELADIDRPEDLHLWRAMTDARPEGLSVVIPTLDEEISIADTVGRAFSAGADEVIVADGGSGDATAEVARDAGAVVLDAPRGRAAQMNAGAAEARGDTLLFLHADTWPPPAARVVVERTLAGSGDGDAGGSAGGSEGGSEDPSGGAIAGAFSYDNRERALGARILGAVGRLRGMITSHPYGDQGIFMRRDVFERLGGFPVQPVMEDWELVRRLKRLGRVVILPDRIATSARSFLEHGLLRGLVTNAAVIAGYRLGVPPERLARWRERIAPAPRH